MISYVISLYTAHVTLPGVTDMPERHFPMEAPSSRVTGAIFFAAGALILIGLGILSRFNFPLFHSIVEILSITVAWSAGPDPPGRAQAPQPGALS